VAMASYELTVRSAAPPEAVFAVIADATRWREWAGPMITTSEWAREGDPPPGGVGAIRRLGRWPAFAQEQILEYRPPRHMAYTIVRGLPVRGYHSDVDLLADGHGGTTINWSGAFEPKVPGTGALLAAMLRKTVLGFARGAAKEPERRLLAA
jgi:uncharacterized protein YndB with AHSA1/START domain